MNKTEQKRNKHSTTKQKIYACKKCIILCYLCYCSVLLFSSVLICSVAVAAVFRSIPLCSVQFVG